MADRSVTGSPEGPDDTNGGDRINAHVSRRFLRAILCPARIIAAVSPLVLVLAGVVALVMGGLILRSFGPRFRVGRLLSATRTMSIAEAAALAAGPPRYIGVTGRLDAEAEFEDDAHRPLVYRRTRLQLGDGRSWRTVDERVEAVAFEIREGLEAIAIDHGAIGEGLVVVPRESVGVAADAAERLPSGTDPATPVRLRVEQVSSIEHAIVLGVPALGADGVARMTSGMGRPLVLTTLEPAEAMRVLTGGRSRRPLLAAVALGSGLVLLTLGLAWAVLGAVTATALGASPSPTAAAGGDPRSSGEGPGLVGDPLFALVAVIGIGLLAAVATLAYVRLTGGRRT